MKGKKRVFLCLILTGIMMMVPAMVFAETEAESLPQFYATFWSLVPPLIAIILALITKEVYSSLFIGILAASLLYSNFQFEGTVEHIYTDGFAAVLSDSYNVGILIFLVVLGSLVALMNRAGGSRAFGKWAEKRIHTRTGAQLATVLLGILIFIDDYFNCLTVGSVMRPVTDRHQVSRAKLAYIIDATAAPVCIIAPISSWAAAVSGFVEGEDGLALFVKSIPYNFYAIVTIVMVFCVIFMNVDFGPMAMHEANAKKGDLFTTGKRAIADEKEKEEETKGKVIDLVIPILCLIFCCVVSMIYTGGFFSGESFVDAFSGCDAAKGLAVGSIFGIVITIVLYTVRRVLKFNDCMECIAAGFRAMVPAILILTFAWTLKAMTDSLGAKIFVRDLMKAAEGNFESLLPALVFAVGCFLAFSTGTSWGTFGILIPIVVDAFKDNPEMMIIAISACMAGAVCGDHCSPISDTTIMASAGAQCEHVSHVSTQLPYAMLAAVISFFSYIVAGYSRNVYVSLGTAIGLMILVMWGIKMLNNYKQKKLEE